MKYLLGKGKGKENKCSAKNIDPNIDTNIEKEIYNKDLLVQVKESTESKVLMDMINEKDKIIIEKEKEFNRKLNQFTLDYRKDKEKMLTQEKELENQIKQLKMKVQMDQEKMLTKEKEVEKQVKQLKCSENKRKTEAFIDKRNKNKKPSQDKSTRISAHGVLHVGFINRNFTNVRHTIFG